MAQQPTVFIVDDDTAVCTAIERLVKTVKLPTQTYSNAQDFLASFQSSAHGCLLLDIRMPGLGGLSLQDQLNKQGMNVPIIFITGYGDIAMAVRAMKAGAVDFLTKPFNPQTLLDSVYQAIEKDRQRHQQRLQRKNILKWLKQLTNRERQILCMTLSGQSNQQIAEDLKISLKTVILHRFNSMKKEERLMYFHHF